jgi:hypothetical protein
MARVSPALRLSMMDIRNYAIPDGSSRQLRFEGVQLFLMFEKEDKR